MIILRKAQDRGHANQGWLDSYHTFSFANYLDRQHMNFRVLRVINEDSIEGGSGFPPHSHSDMEIITYVIDGALEHKDSMGNSTIIRPGEVQRMSAGTGVQHSEFNHFKDKKTHLLQIWILPKKLAVSPSYEQKLFDDLLSQRTGLTLLASPEGRQNSVSINQDVEIFQGRVEQNDSLNFSSRPGRHIWIQEVKGQLTVNGQRLEPGDGLALSEEPTLTLSSPNGAEFLLFELP